MLLRRRACGELTQAEIRCARCGEPLHADEVTVEPRPGSAGASTRVVAERLSAVIPEANF